MKTVPLCEVRGLKKYYSISKAFSRRKRIIPAVNGVDLEIEKAETLGIVGESGCGKTTLALLTLGLIEPTSGEVFFERKNLLKMPKNEARKLRREMQIVFQDPQSSLNPRRSIRDILLEPFRIHSDLKLDSEKMLPELVQSVGLAPYHLDKYPHELSGGERQRVSIARALALNPKLIFLDEPVSSLDLSIRGQILVLLKDLQETFGLTYAYISHDLSTVKYFCSRVVVMYLGKIIEMAPTEVLFKNPQHPYTKLLFSSIPSPDPSKSRIGDMVAADVETYQLDSYEYGGCSFYPRCTSHTDEHMKCSEACPSLASLKGEKDHFVACFKCDTDS